MRDCEKPGWHGQAWILSRFRNSESPKIGGRDGNRVTFAQLRKSATITGERIVLMFEILLRRSLLTGLVAGESGESHEADALVSVEGGPIL